MTEDEIEQNMQAFREMGYNSTVAYALAEREKTPADVLSMGVHDILDEVLSWNGIIGFTGEIIDAVDNIRNVEAL